jgi:hypothetical protein
VRSRAGALAGLLGLVLATAVGGAAAAPPTDRVLPPDQHTSDKGRRLAHAHEQELRQLSAEIYNCLPWVDVRKDGIGFYKPKHLSGDPRYLSLNIDVEQEPSAEFSAFTREERASRMFSRYVAPMLRRVAEHQGLVHDPLLDGFTVIVSWLKAVPKRGGPPPVNETIAAFIPRAVADDYLGGRLPVGELADRAYVLAWDGETPVGPIRVTAWNDNFLSTYKVANYQPEPGVTCAQAQ